MDTEIRKYSEKYCNEAMKIWNEVVKDAVAFPQIDELTEQNANEFFLSQTFTGVAFDTQNGEAVGLYILHPNNVGRCAHISNASFAVKGGLRGNGIGKKLVTHCLETAKSEGFKILQFNAVVKSNFSARKLYEKLGFIEIGTVPGGFMHKDGHYEDIVLYYHTL